MAKIRCNHIFLGVLWILFSLGCSWQAQAHQIGISKGTYTTTPQSLVVVWDLAREDLRNLLPKMDTNRNKALEKSELKAAHTPLEALWNKRLLVWQGDKPCKASLEATDLLEKDGVSIHLRYRCQLPKAPMRWRIDLLEDLAPGHRHLAIIHTGDKPQQAIFFRKQREFRLSKTPSPKTAHAHIQGVSAFFTLGIEHILFGWDHLLFLLALILLGGSWKALLGIITAFTVAHSITLSIAVMGYWVPSPKVIEPLIALSVAYVGLENFFVEKIDHRWKLTFAFGLIHGFGFAGALGTVQIPTQQMGLSLLLFNLGVETGQIALLALVLPLLHLARQKSWLDRRITLVISCAVALAGGFWFLERIFS